MLSIQHIGTAGTQFVIRWANGQTTKFPFIFLRDNCPCCRHANGQKLIETPGLDMGVTPLTFTANNQQHCLQVVWQPGSHASTYPFAWLSEHSLTTADIAARNSAAEAAARPVLWRNHWPAGLPVHDYLQLTQHNALFEWLDTIKQHGFGLLRNVPAQPGMVLQVATLFGYVRETNYGRLFNVKTEINPNNLAYTGLGISPHTDNPYRVPVPTLQLLHCISSTAEGGESVLVDGFMVAESLRSLHPHWFYLLQVTPVTFCFKDGDSWHEHTTTIIETGAAGQITAVNFNNRSIQPFNIDEDNMQAFYEAYIAFARMLSDDKYALTFKMCSGDLYIVNNRRVLHGRGAYNNTGGERWLQGAYADVDGLMS
jgi:gamma-butyrobetaine dioxygenase